MSDFLHIPTVGTHPTPPISSAVRTGTLVFVSGTPGFQTGGMLGDSFELQFDATVVELDRVLAAASGNLRDIVKVNVLLTRAGDIPEMNRRYARVFGPAPFPARTTCVVAALPHPDMLIEIEAVAVLRQSAPSY